MWKHIYSSCALVALLSNIANAGLITLSIFTSTGARATSPSFTAYRDNALNSMRAGGGIAIGDPSATPTAYRLATNIGPADLINSNGGGGPSFNSWSGIAAPAGAFANEFGTQLSFGLRILGNGTKFDISNIGFASTSTDVFGTFSFSNPNLFGGSGYNASRVGVIYGPNGNTLVTSGPATQLVDEFDYVGIGLSLDATGTGGLAQQKLDTEFNEFAEVTPFSITGTYVVRDNGGAVLASAGANVNVAAVPEPHTMSSVALGLLALALGVAKSRAH
ncbi:MAG: hypothetical protein ACR2NN_29565 [Bryobacteraceae bacterium]